MQTFLPYNDYAKSASVLDRQRLGKQRVETWQILKILLGMSPKSRWRNHPAVRMWRGHTQSLIEYGIAVCQEWIKRGYKDTLLERFQQQRDPKIPLTMPSWLNDDFCMSHRSNLMRKNRDYYYIYFGEISGDMPYVWPVD